jgi:hypothetical protein
VDVQSSFVLQRLDEPLETVLPAILAEIVEASRLG